MTHEQQVEAYDHWMLSTRNELEAEACRAHAEKALTPQAYCRWYAMWRTDLGGEA